MAKANRQICPGCGNLVTHIEGQTWRCTVCQAVFRPLDPLLVCVKDGTMATGAGREAIGRIALQEPSEMSNDPKCVRIETSVWSVRPDAQDVEADETPLELEKEG